MLQLHFYPAAFAVYIILGIKKMRHLLLLAEKAQTVAPLGVQIPPNIPILYFGNLEAYQQSEKRIVTVALNPSDIEFPSTTPLLRFPQLSLYNQANPLLIRHQVLLDAYKGYFSPSAFPYMKWFGNFNEVLSGFAASFRGNLANTALHTDLLSPVATKPTWSGLQALDSARLLANGVPLWHELIEYLQPHILIVSVAKQHMQRINFPRHGKPNPPLVHVFPKKARYPVCAHSIQLKSGMLTDIIYSTPAQVPFGFLTHVEKQQVASPFRFKLANW